MVLERGVGEKALVLLALAVVALPWFFVARRFQHASPVRATDVQPQGVVWSGRVFSSSGDLARWLRGRGASYATWGERHPRAQAVVEHRPVPAARRPVPAAHEAAPPSRKADPRPAPAASGTPKATHAAPRRVTGGGGGSNGAIRALLGLAGLLVAFAASAGLLLRRAGPGWSNRVGDLRIAAIAAAMSIAVGVLAAAALR